MGWNCRANSTTKLLFLPVTTLQAWYFLPQRFELRLAYLSAIYMPCSFNCVWCNLCILGLVCCAMFAFLQADAFGAIAIGWLVWICRLWGLKAEFFRDVEFQEQGNRGQEAIARDQKISGFFCANGLGGRGSITGYSCFH